MTDIKTVSSRAKWNIQELIPVLVAGIIGVAGLLAGLTKTFTTAGMYTTCVIGFGLALYLIYENVRRKKNSQLNATYTPTVPYRIIVWMNRPKKDKWMGKLDKNTNGGNLLDTERIIITNVMDTRTIGFVTNTSTIYIPTRFFKDNQELRVFVATALSELEKTPKFANAKDKEEVKKLLSGILVINEKVEKEIYEPETPSAKSKKQNINKPYTAEELNLTVAPSPVTEKKIQATRVIGYEKYRKVTQDDAINKAINTMNTQFDNEVKEAEEKENLTSVLGSLPKESSDSISINFDTDHNKTQK